MIRLILGLAFAAIASAQVPWIFVNTLPGLCRVGESYFVTTAAAGSQLFYCSSPNIFTPVGSGGGSVIAGTGITVVGSTVSADTAVILSRATAQAGTSLKCLTSTSTSAPVCSLTPTLTAYTDGMILLLDPHATLSSSATLNVDALGARKLYKMSSGAAAQIGASDVLDDGKYIIAYSAALDSGTGGFFVVPLEGNAGGGATSLSGLTDLQVTKSSGTVIAVAAGTQVKGNTATSVSAATATITAGSGNGTAIVYITEGDAIVVEHPTAAGITITCSGCTQSQVTTPAVPSNSRHLASVTISSGAWGTVTDKRGIGAIRPLISGTGISIVDSGGVATINIDTADVPRLGSMNAFTGTVDTSGGSLVQPRASGAPSSGSCDSAGEVGAAYVDSANGGLSYDCKQVGTSTYGWVARGGGSSTPSITRDYIFIDEEFLPANTAQTTIGSYNFSYTGGGGVAHVSSYSTANHPGVYRITSNASANSFAGLHLGGNVDTGWLASPNTSGWDSVFVFYPEFTGNQSHVIVGWTDGVSDAPTNGVYARVYNSSSGCTANNNSEGTFQFVGRAASTETASASTKTVTTATWYSLRIRSTTSGTILYSLAKGDTAPESEVSVASNVPTATLFPAMYIVTCDTNVARMYGDRFAFLRTGLTR